MAVLEQQIPVGDWQVDRVHSSVGFAVKHMVSAFRGQFDDYDVTLSVADGQDPTLTGTARVESVNVKLADLKGHLQSPEFFDAERHPELRFESTSFRIDGDNARVEGKLTLKGVTEDVSATGTISFVEADLAGGPRIGLELEAVVDRNVYGIDWNAPLPKGGKALGDEVIITIHAELTPEG